jgi:predicted DNA-binding transcriptional regulator AlpA
MADTGVIPKPINIGAKKHFAWFEDDINRYVLIRLSNGGAA